MGNDINIEIVENGIVVKTHEVLKGEGKQGMDEYKDETRVFPDIDEFQQWFTGSHFSKGKKFNKEKGKIEQIITGA